MNASRFIAILAVLAMVIAGFAVVTSSADASADASPEYTVAYDSDTKLVTVTTEDVQIKESTLSAFESVMGEGAIIAASDDSYFELYIANYDETSKIAGYVEKITDLNDNFEIEVSALKVLTLTMYLADVSSLSEDDAKVLYSNINKIYKTGLSDVTQFVSLKAYSSATLIGLKDAQIAALNVKIEALDAQIAEKDAQIAELEKAIAEMEPALKAKIAELEAQVAALELEKKALVDEKAELEEQVAGLQGDVKAQKDKVTLFQALTGVFAFVAIVLAGFIVYEFYFKAKKRSA